MDRGDTVYDYLRDVGWVPVGKRCDVTFLAAGEYNENYLVKSSQGSFVFRINHGSQLDLDNQIEYEFQVLEALSDSGVTPSPLYYSTNPGSDLLGKGVLLMEFLPGKPLDYERDAGEAARILAQVHAQPVGRSLLIQSDSVRDIARESLGLIERYPGNHPMESKRAILLDYHETVLALAQETEALFAAEPLVIVNTEVNSHNFIMDHTPAGKRGFLVDWEKAVVSCRYQDLGHFLVPTTTLWKTNKRYSSREKEAFLREYLKRTGLDYDMEEMVYKTNVLERTILLRALSWCFMAFYEYTKQDRALTNETTFRKINQYLDEMECFFK